MTPRPRTARGTSLWIGLIPRRESASPWADRSRSIHARPTDEAGAKALPVQHFDAVAARPSRFRSGPGKHVPQRAQQCRVDAPERKQQQRHDTRTMPARPLGITIPVLTVEIISIINRPENTREPVHPIAADPDLRTMQVYGVGVIRGEDLMPVHE